MYVFFDRVDVDKNWFLFRLDLVRSWDFGVICVYIFAKCTL